MSNKILNHIKKIVIICMITVLCSPYAVSAFSFTNRTNTNLNRKGFFENLIGIIFNIGKEEEKEDTEDVIQDIMSLTKMDPKNLKMEDIMNIINKLPISLEKLELEKITNAFNIFENSGKLELNIGSLVNTLISVLSPVVDELVGTLSGSSLNVKPEEITLDLGKEQTAVKFAGDSYSAKLTAKVYKNSQSTKWALLIHPFMMSGKTMANAVGPYYYNKGYNILAVDLRGFGNSEGSVALGLLESLDIYDWLVKLNNDYKPSQVIVHGTSLGAATTNFLSGIDKFMPAEMELMPISKLGVVGLIEDCGYADMKQFANESFIKSLNVGLENKDFDYYSNALYSLKYCELPMLIIHGDADTMVNYEKNALVIRDAVNNNEYAGTAELVTITGGAHALVVMGNNNVYENAVNKFIEARKDEVKESTETPKETETENENEKQETLEDTEKTDKKKNPFSWITDWIRNRH